MNLAEIRTTKMFLTLQPDLDHASGGSFIAFIFEL